MPDELLSFDCEHDMVELAKEMSFVSACYDLLVTMFLDGGSRQSSSTSSSIGWRIDISNPAKVDFVSIDVGIHRHGASAVSMFRCSATHKLSHLLQCGKPERESGASAHVASIAFHVRQCAGVL